MKNYEKNVYIYAIKTTDSMLYIGASKNPMARVNKHKSGHSGNSALTASMNKGVFRLYVHPVAYTPEKASLKEIRIIKTLKRAGLKVLNNDKARPYFVTECAARSIYRKKLDAIKVSEITRKYKTIMSFAKDNSTLYQYIVGSEIYNEVFSHMPKSGNKGAKRWTKERAIERLISDGSWHIFSRKSGGAHRWLKKHKLDAEVRLETRL